MSPLKLDVLSYTDVFLYNKGIDSLRRIGEISIERTVKRDINTISSQYLIDQIELAFKAWSKPWSRNINFDDFCNYILPYRGGDEPLSTIRGVLFDRYIQALDTVQGLDSSLEACKIINKIITVPLKSQNIF